MIVKDLPQEIPALVSILEKSHYVTSLPLSLLTSNNEIVFQIGFKSICSEFHCKHNESQSCLSRITQDNSLREPSIVHSQKCRFGLNKIEITLVLSDNTLLKLVIGQFIYTDEYNHEFFINQAREYNYDQNHYFSALRNVPSLSKLQIAYIKDFYQEIAEQLVEINSLNKELSENNKELIHTKLLYEAFFNQEMHSTILFEPHNLKIVDFNEKTANYLGIKKEDKNKYFLYEFIKDASIQQIKRRIDNLKKKKKDSVSIQVRSKDGRSFNALTEMSILRLPDSELISCVCKDTIEVDSIRKQEKEHLEFLQILLNTMPVPIFYKDKDLRYLGCNDAFSQKIGIHIDDIIGKTPEDVFSDELAQFYKKSDLVVLETNQKQRYEGRALFSDDRLHDIMFYKAPYSNTDNEIAGIIGIMFDLTEIKDKDTEINLLASALEQAYDPIIIIDIKGKIRFANKAVTKVLGYSSDDLTDSNIQKLINKNDASKLPAITRFLKEGQSWSEIIDVDSKFGRKLKLELNISPVKDKNHINTNYVIFMKDITELDILEKQLEKAQRMQAIGNLASGIAHEFNNKLTIILGYSELLAMDISEDSALHSDIRQVIDTTKSAQKLVKQLLTFGISDVNRKALINPSPLFKEIVKNYKSEYPELSINYSIDINSSILADISQIQQIATILMDHSIALVDKKSGNILFSALEIKWENIPEEKRSGLILSDYVKISVRNNANESITSIKDALSNSSLTIHTGSIKSGLGLKLIDSIVKLYSGIIDYANNKDTGQIYEVYLPIGNNDSK